MTLIQRKGQTGKLMFKRNKQAVSLSEPGTFSGMAHWFRLALLLLITVVAIVWGYMKLTDPETLPITKVRALGDFSFVTEAMLHQALTIGVKTNGNSGSQKDIFENKGFFNIDVEAIKQRVETMPWVKQASVQRVWPESLIIEVVEHKPIAYWGENGLVSQVGEVFYPAKETLPGDLPRFIATQGQAKKCLRYFNDANEMFSKINVKVNAVKFNARQALTLTLDNNIELNLGRQNKLYRLQRFAQVFSALTERVSLIERIDMRYTNGFSVKWKQHQKNGELYKNVKSNKAHV